ncbi:hypothetical protein BSKO_09402 [Bryopsis sp. KO-2023]|nr:hypothetical protein BSKO_09402 [Bryopsis sp. KO-2023]
MRSATQVVPGLFIGCVETVVDFCEIKKGTHVLTILNEELVPVLGNDIRHMVVHALDMEEAMLLNHLDDCITFIENALSEKALVLVHCFAGVSRSSTVVIAYLMKTKGWTFNTAFSSLKKTYSPAHPNSGFIEQLQIFEKMGCRIVTSHPEYKRWKLKALGNKFLSGDLVEASDIENAPNEEDVALSQDSLFRCRKCGRLLATYQNLAPLNPSGDEPHKSASSVFVEPLSWMKNVTEGALEGKIYCPQCNTKLGSFNWSGIKDESGMWVTPAFQLHLKNLDEVSSKPVESLSHRVRQPRFGSAPKQPENLAKQDSGSRGFDYFIFDCDGVLVDSERASCEALRLGILEATGVDIPHQFPTDFNEVFGMDIRTCLEHYARIYERADWMEDIEALLTKVSIAKEKAYKELTAAGISAFPGVSELIKKLMAFGVPFGVGSSGSPEKIHHNLQSAGLSGLFPDDKIVSAKMVDRGKPAPDVYIEVLQRLECTNPTRALIIEDSINGLKAGEAAGAYTVGITTSLPREKLEPHADRVIDIMSELEIFVSTADKRG